MGKNRYILAIGHPAHYHLFKIFIRHCLNNNFDLKVVIINKDILEELLIKEKVPFTKILSKKNSSSILNKFKELKEANKQFSKIVEDFKPNLLLGCSNQIAHIGYKKRIPSIFFAEDDFKATFLQGLLVYPFIKTVITPVSTNIGPFKWKQIQYQSFHELAYLHPNHFKPLKEKVSHLFKDGKPYFILRFANLKAYHDINKGGINKELAFQIIELLKPYGNVYITSEKAIDKEFEEYLIKISSNDMHHAIYYANMFIGDSQTMAAEAAVLGTPSLRFNSFVGKLGYLEELEHKYNLTFGFKPDHPIPFLEKIKELLLIKDLKAVWNERRSKLLNEKIDYSKLMIWFIENYPQSAKIMKDNPDYQHNFK